jgi:hypothetical protein
MDFNSTRFNLIQQNLIELSLNLNSKELNSGFKRIVATLTKKNASMVIQKYLQLQEFSDG